MMRKTLKELADFVQGTLVGDDDIVITGISGIQEAQSGDLTFIAEKKYLPLVKESRASAVIGPRSLDITGIPVIQTDNPALAFARVASLVQEKISPAFAGTHLTAVVDETASLDHDVHIGPFVIIEPDVTIGSGTVIHGHCVIGRGSTIGENCLLYSHVAIREQSVIGNRVIVHNSSVIGSDGFGYVPHDGRHEKIPQIGIVVIGDDVEIGACTTIDRARFDKTVIGSGTKIDNLVQIAHNVIIGENCIICAQVGMAGSCVIEDNVVLAGQVGLAGHLTIGANAVVASGSGVPSSIPAGEIYWGFPAKPQKDARRVNAAVQRLPHYVKVIQDLKLRIEELEKNITK